jgi:hypothetical protein
VWVLVENPLCGFPSRGGRRSFVHGGGSVHAVVELREDASELHHYKEALDSRRCQLNGESEGLQSFGQSRGGTLRVMAVEVLRS